MVGRSSRTRMFMLLYLFCPMKSNFYFIMWRLLRFFYERADDDHTPSCCGYIQASSNTIFSASTYLPQFTLYMTDIRHSNALQACFLDKFNNSQYGSKHIRWQGKCFSSDHFVKIFHCPVHGVFIAYSRYIVNHKNLVNPLPRYAHDTPAILPRLPGLKSPCYAPDKIGAYYGCRAKLY